MMLTLEEAVAKAVSLNTEAFPPNSSGAMKKMLLNVSLEIVAGLFGVNVTHPAVHPYYHEGRP